MNQIYIGIEIELNEKIVKLLNWKFTCLNEETVFCKNGFPVITGNKILIPLNKENLNQRNSRFLTFRPLKNSKHCQFLIDKLYDEEDIEVLVTAKFDSIKYPDKNYYISSIINKNNEVVLKTKKFFTETASKFVAVYNYYFENDDIDTRVRKILKYDDQLKEEQIKNTKKKRSGFNKFKNFSSLTNVDY